ncbi:MAG: hypothetical protein EOP06_28190, partial [Proteobacteria bacterium]
MNVNDKPRTGADELVRAPKRNVFQKWITLGILLIGSQMYTTFAEAALWTTCAREGQFCNFSGSAQVRYGNSGAGYFTGSYTNGVNCSNAVFGDPAVAQAKGCEYSSDIANNPVDPNAGWVTCANEGGTCSFNGSAPVRYGTDTMYVMASITNGTACTNEVFGDPASGYGKTCRYQASALVAAPTVITNSNWVQCASEGGTCNFSGTTQVRYGTDANYYSGTFSNNTPCSNGVFGDPAVG